MDEFELFRHVTIGQYLPTGSALHRLDPRVKIIGLVVLMLVLVAYPWASGLIAGLAVVLGLVALARVRVGFVLGGLAPALPVLAFLALLQLFLGWGVTAPAGCPTLWAWRMLSVTTCSVQAVVMLAVRFTALFVLVSLLTLTSTITELTRGAESLMRPLQRWGVPADELAMVFTLAFRFVPTLAQEMEKMLKAQASRGADIRGGSNPIQRTRQLLPVLVPLFITTLRRADELTLAMEARGYTGGAGRTRYVRLHFQWADLAALLLVAVVAAGLLGLPFGALDQRALAWLASSAGR